MQQAYNSETPTRDFERGASGPPFNASNPRDNRYDTEGGSSSRQSSLVYSRRNQYAVPAFNTGETPSRGGTVAGEIVIVGINNNSNNANLDLSGVGRQTHFPGLVGGGAGSTNYSGGNWTASGRGNNFSPRGTGYRGTAGQQQSVLKQGIVEILLTSNEYIAPGQSDRYAPPSLSSSNKAQSTIRRSSQVVPRSFRDGTVKGSIPQSSTFGGPQSNHQPLKTVAHKTGRTNSLGIDVRSNQQRIGQIAGLDVKHSRRVNLLPDLFKTSQAGFSKQNQGQTFQQHSPTVQQAHNLLAIERRAASKEAESTQFDKLVLGGGDTRSSHQSRPSFIAMDAKRFSLKNEANQAAIRQFGSAQLPHEGDRDLFDQMEGVDQDHFNMTGQTLATDQSLTYPKPSSNAGGPVSQDPSKVLELDMRRPQGGHIQIQSPQSLARFDQKTQPLPSHQDVDEPNRQQSITEMIPGRRFKKQQTFSSMFPEGSRRRDSLIKKAQSIAHDKNAQMLQDQGVAEERSSIMTDQSEIPLQPEDSTLPNAGAMYFKKQDSKVDLQRQSLAKIATSLQASNEELQGMDPSMARSEQLRQAEASLQLMMRLVKTGVYAPSVKSKSVTAPGGMTMHKDTSLATVKKAIAKGFKSRQKPFSNHPRPTQQTFKQNETSAAQLQSSMPSKASPSTYQSQTLTAAEGAGHRSDRPSAVAFRKSSLHSGSMQSMAGRESASAIEDLVKSRINNQRPKDPHDSLQPYDFGIPENDYSWKTQGANRLLYHLTEKDRFERLKVNQKLTDELLKKMGQQTTILEKNEDCTKHFTRMVNEYKENSEDLRPYPTQQDEVPLPLNQKEQIVEKLKEQREALEKHNAEMRQQQTLKNSQGPKVSKESLLKILRDIDNQDQQKALFGVNEQQFLIRKHNEQWIKSRKNAGLHLISKMKDMEFAKQIFKAWDTNSKGYLTAKEMSEQLVGLGLSTDIAFTQRLLVTLKDETLKQQVAEVEVLTLKDFLKVFNYENFGQRACDIIKEEFKSSLQVQLSKQRNVEQAFREQQIAALMPQTASSGTAVGKQTAGSRIRSTKSFRKRRQGQGSYKPQQKTVRSGSITSQDTLPHVPGNQALTSQGSQESLLKSGRGQNDLEEILSISDAARESLNSRDAPSTVADFEHLQPGSPHSSIHGMSIGAAPHDSFSSRVQKPLNINTRLSKGIKDMSATLGSPTRRELNKGASFASNYQAQQHILPFVPTSKISLSKSSRTPTLPEKMNIVDKWFASVACGKTARSQKNFKMADVRVEAIAELLVAKQLVSDKDTGVKHIMKSLRVKESEQDRKDFSLNYALFQRLFCRSIFKESLIEVLHEIEEGVQRKTKGELSAEVHGQPPALRQPTLRSRQPAHSPPNHQASFGDPLKMATVHETEDGLVSCTSSLVSPRVEVQSPTQTSAKLASMKRVSVLVAEAKSEAYSQKRKEKELKKKEKNLTLEIKNYQRKTMLNGIDQQEILDELYDLVQNARQQGVNPIAVSNFKGKDILDNLHELKTQYDKDYFRRQTYREFLQDPLGSKLIDAWAATDKDVILNDKARKRMSIVITKIANETSQVNLDPDSPSLKKQNVIEEEARRIGDGRGTEQSNLVGAAEAAGLKEEPIRQSPQRQFTLKLKH